LKEKIKQAGIDISVQKAIEELKGVQKLTYRLPKSRTEQKQILKTNTVQKMLNNLKI
jgi:septum formation inhibitor-activating ATPase MinD